MSYWIFSGDAGPTHKSYLVFCEVFDGSATPELLHMVCDSSELITRLESIGLHLEAQTTLFPQQYNSEWGFVQCCNQAQI